VPVSTSALVEDEDPISLLNRRQAVGDQKGRSAFMSCSNVSTSRSDLHCRGQRASSNNKIRGFSRWPGDGEARRVHPTLIPQRLILVGKFMMKS
jgi:hypothetical protein